MHFSVFSGAGESLLDIHQIGFSEDTKITRFGPGQRNHYIIHYVTKGKGFYNGAPVSEGQGFLIFPGQHEEYHADKTDPWAFLWIISSDKGMENIFKRYNANPETLIFNYDSVTVLKKAATDIMSKKNPILDPYEILEMFLHIFNSHTFKNPRSEHTPSSDVYLEFALNYIDTNIHKKITVGELTSLLGISQPYLYRIFSERFDMSPKQYIVRHKLYHAKKLLTDTDMTITDIAGNVGYGDILAFSKMFSSKEKVSPQEYRKLKKQDRNIFPVAKKE